MIESPDHESILPTAREFVRDVCIAVAIALAVIGVAWLGGWS